MKAAATIAGGLAGAGALTLIHESVRKVNPDAPRMDLMGMDALRKSSRHYRKLDPQQQFIWAMAGDLAGNALYYSLAGIGRKKGVWWRGSALGMAAGLGALLLPKQLGLNSAYSNRTTQTKLMTLGWYLVGGLVAAAVTNWLDRQQEKAEQRRQEQEGMREAGSGI